jgi:flotillin
MIVLNGAQGISDALAQALSQGVAGMQMARRLLSDPRAATEAPAANGAGPADGDVRAETERV